MMLVAVVIGSFFGSQIGAYLLYRVRVYTLEKRLRRLETLFKMPLSIIAKGEMTALAEVLRRQELNPDLHKNRFDLN